MKKNFKFQRKESIKYVKQEISYIVAAHRDRERSQVKWGRGRAERRRHKSQLAPVQAEKWLACCFFLLLLHHFLYGSNASTLNFRSFVQRCRREIQISNLPHQSQLHQRAQSSTCGWKKVIQAGNERVRAHVRPGVHENVGRLQDSQHHGRSSHRSPAHKQTGPRRWAQLVAGELQLPEQEHCDARSQSGHVRLMLGLFSCNYIYIYLSFFDAAIVVDDFNYNWKLKIN